MAMAGRYLHLWKNATSKVKFSTSVVGSIYDSSRSGRRSGTGGDVVMRADVIEKLKRNSLRKKLDVESELADWDDPNFPAATFLERVCSKDMDILKGLLKDMRNLNRKNMNKLERRQKKEELIKQQQDDTDIEDGVYGSTLHVPDQATADIARHIVQAYNQQQNLKLEFARVIDVVQDPYPLHYHLLIEARDLNAASVPIKLQAFYTINPKEFKVNNVLQPVPFMKLLYKDKDEEKKKLSLEERETLLYANIRDCPIIAKRLGLKGGPHQVFCKRLRPPHDDCSSMGRPPAPFLKDSANSISLIKLSLDDHDETLLCLAKFAVAEQSANQGSHLEFLSVVGAWREVRVGDRYKIDHMMLEALENGVGRRFYAAVASESNGKDAQLVEWVPTNSQKITLNEGGKV